METTPGFDATLGVRGGPVVDGRAEVRLDASQRHLNPAGTVHGGVIMTLVDLAMGRAAVSLVDTDQMPVTIEMKVNFLEPGRIGEIVASAVVLRRGRLFTVVQAEVWQADGHDALAEAIGTFTSPREA
jgi:uncharacterized protein (TIGR00369 family)